MNFSKGLLAAIFTGLCTSAVVRPVRGGAATQLSIPVVIHNYNGAGTNDFDQISHLDVAGNQIEVHDGQMLQVGNVVYNIGASYSCGFKYSSSTNPWCGFPVYTSTDLLHWTKIGFLFDSALPVWQFTCGNFYGCWGPHMVYNAANKNYVLWFVGTGSSTDNYLLFTCTLASPGANFSCTLGATPHHLAHPGGDDLHLFVDPKTQIGYIIYSSVNSSPSFQIYIDQLNADYTDSTGTSIAISATADGLHEGEAMFYNAGSPRPYVITWSGGCPYCQSTVSWSETATSPMGPYGNQVKLNATSCGGQMRSVDLLTANGRTTPVYQSSQWEYNQQNNEGLSNIYYQPLSFDKNGSVIPFPCNAAVSIPGFLTISSTPPERPAGADQQDFGDRFNAFADFFNPSIWRMQTFVPTVSTLSKIVMPLGQAYTSGGALNSDPVVELVTLDARNNPVAVLSSVTVPRSSLRWSLQMTTLNFSYSGLIPGRHYGIVLKNTGSQGLMAQAFYTGAANPYPAGLLRYTSDGGKNWVTDTNRALEFATFP